MASENFIEQRSLSLCDLLSQNLTPHSHSEDFCSLDPAGISTGAAG